MEKYFELYFYLMAAFGGFAFFAGFLFGVGVVCNKLGDYLDGR